MMLNTRAHHHIPVAFEFVDPFNLIPNDYAYRAHHFSCPRHHQDRASRLSTD